MLYDVFISHASEDKDGFVRPLADQLREHHVEVWYDEFSLRLGDSLRRSIDQGLARSRFGIVVLSPAFFEKRWPQRELDGLTAREMIDGNRVVLPIWHGVTKNEVVRYSPPLADAVAVDSAEGVKAVVRKILDVIRPQGSPLVIARDELLRRGGRPPVVTDEWWLDVVEASNREPCAGFAMQRRHWGRWTFPLPVDGTTPLERGERLAWTAMQMAWEEAAEKEWICQITLPDDVLAFIGRHMSLAEVCHKFPRYLATYAPQLTIPGFGGEFEPDFDRLLEASMKECEARRAREERFGSALSTDGLPPGCDGEIALRHPHLGYYQPSRLASHFVSGNLGGPPAAFFELIDCIFWFLSTKSTWLPSHIRNALMLGTTEWHVWWWDEKASRDEALFGIEPHAHRGTLFRALSRAKSLKSFRISPEARLDLIGRATVAVDLLDLPETPETLADRFLAAGYIAAYFGDRTRTQGSTRTRPPSRAKRSRARTGES